MEKHQWRVLIAGSRTFVGERAYLTLKEQMRDFLIISEIVSGCAKGADTLGERYAREKGIPVKKFPADWDRYGKSAGYKRNEQMAEYADIAVVFWDGQSRGSQHMIDIMKKKGKKVIVAEFSLELQNRLPPLILD